MDQTHGLTGREFQQSQGTQDWRVLGVDAVAWYAAPSHAQGVALARRAVEILAGLIPTTEGSDVTLPDIDVRAGGVRVRLGRERGARAGR